MGKNMLGMHTGLVGKMLKLIILLSTIYFTIFKSSFHLSATHGRSGEICII